MGGILAAKAKRALRAVGRGVRDLPSRWRRSLQFRVVTVTMVASLTVAAALGYYIVYRVAQGIVQTRLNAASEQAMSGFNAAQTQLNTALEGGNADINQLARDIVRQLSNSSANGSQFQVVLEISEGGSNNSSFSSPAVDPSTLPKDLVAQVQNPANSGQPLYQFAPVGYTQPDNSTQYIAALVWGEHLSLAQTTQTVAANLYYVFSLQQDQQTLTLVEVALTSAGFVLVLTLAGIAWFISRQVVIPVRAAAAIAERLASGRLEERMRERGEDDLASLASSFNKMAATLQSQIRRWEELSRVQRRFVSDVSHELRTPLTTVRMAADLIHEERDSFEPAVARSAELLQNQLDRFESLLADLLEISRFDAGAAILDAEPVDLRMLVARVVESSAPLAERKGSRVLVQSPPDPAVAEVDARRIDRVLRNLVVNAIEHGEGRDVVVTVAASDDAVAVAVRDHGVGLRPGESSLVFNRFWRADPARARTTGGTGLGLAIALEDARLHNGWLQAWGEPGGGSQFRLTVPRSPVVELLRSPIPLEPEDSAHHLRQRRGAIPAPPPRAQLAPRRESDGASGDAASGSAGAAGAVGGGAEAGARPGHGPARSNGTGAAGGVGGGGAARPGPADLSFAAGPGDAGARFAEASESAEATEPIKPVEPVESAESVAGTEPVEAVGPEEHAEPAEPDDNDVPKAADAADEVPQANGAGGRPGVSDAVEEPESDAGTEADAAEAAEESGGGHDRPIG